MSSTTPLDVGIVGLGGIATHHANCLREQSAVLAGGMDVDATARETFAAEFGVETYADHADLFEGVDAVIVTTPNRFHEEYAVAALEAGLPVLVEKPLAHTLDSAERIAAAAADSGAFCMVGFHNRYDPAIEALSAYRDRGFFGPIQHVDATYLRRRGIPGQGTWFTREEVAGGGALIDLGVHALDMALYLAGFPEVVEVSGVTRSTFGTREDYVDVDGWGVEDATFDVEDSVIAQLRTDDDTTITLDVAWAANRDPEKSLRVRGADGGAFLDFREQLRLFESSPSGVDHHRTTEVEVAEREAHVAEQAAFLEGVATGEPPTRNTIEQALTVQRVIDAIYRSSEGGGAVGLD